MKTGISKRLDKTIKPKLPKTKTVVEKILLRVSLKVDALVAKELKQVLKFHVHSLERELIKKIK